MLDQPCRIEMMGGLRLSRGDDVVTHFKSRKVAVLLAYLAFYSSRHHNREELQTLLWPEDSLNAARNSLRVALSLLRRDLGTDVNSTDLVLCSDRSEVWLNPNAITTDTNDFDGMYAAALHSESDLEQYDLLKSLVDSFRGDLLPGYYEDWVLSERSRINETYLQALRKLVRAIAARREYEYALEYARTAVQLDPLREESVRDLMRLYVAVHQPSAALQQHKELEARLKAALQVRPGAATRELARRISEGLDRGAGASVVGTTLEPPTEASSSAGSVPAATASKASQHRIPVPPTRFFGREHELSEIKKWATVTIEESQEQQPSATPRLLTLTGPGGTGKSRLAMQVGKELQIYWQDTIWRNTIWFVPLADLTDANHIPDAIAAAMDFAPADRSGLAARIAVRLNSTTTILILDNIEHLVEGATPLLQMLMEQAPSAGFIITSRRPLGLPGERQYPIPPLPVPIMKNDPPAAALSSGGAGRRASPISRRPPASSVEAIGDVAQCAAVQLFLDRAQAVGTGFCLTANNIFAVSALCRQLEGLPLSLELAAARIGVLSPDQMLAYVGRRLDLLVDPNAYKDGRHRSLRAAIEWSYRLLSPEERRLFSQLSVFEGGCTLAAALAICSDVEAIDALEQLKMNSLVQTEITDHEMRFRMLETLRSFAAEHLTAGESLRLRPKHALYYLALAEEAEPNVKGPEEAQWLDLLQREHDNFRAALSWLIEDPNGGVYGLRLACALWRFWIGRGYLAEGRERFEAALAHVGAQETTPHRARALMYGGDLANSQSDFGAAQSLLERALAAFRSLGSQGGAANALSRLGLVKMRSGDYEVSRRLQEESLALFEINDDTEGIATSSSYLGLLAISQGDYALARTCNERCLAIYRNLGNRRNLAMTLGNLGLIAEHLGEYNAARGLQEESLAIHTELGTQQGMAAALSNLSIILIKLGERGEGRKRLLEGLALFRKIGSRHSMIISLETVAGIALSDGQWSRAAWLYGAAEGAREVLGAATAPRDQEDRQRDFAILRDRLGDEAFYLERTKGTAANLEQAMDFVLADSGDEG